ncbi:GNAT family N-acetyltransferase [Halobacillus sp. K22]|uniref:GNAT family N-acetyltransferase n=1 Tax=Halobacillus sp. K22 TaxID=3457431 RepID=UPI003FCED16C
MEEYKVIQASAEDIDFLWEMLYQAIYVADHSNRPTRDILNHPDIASYLSGWGRPGDVAILAVRGGERIGAVWCRLFEEEGAPHGFINRDIPVLSLALLPEHRNRGIGSLLLDRFMEELKCKGYSSLSLSVDPDNPAKRFYERKGFVKIGESGTSWDMKLELVN